MPSGSALEQHLAGCARCRDTLAAFARGAPARLRHAPSSSRRRDLGARVRAGIDCRPSSAVVAAPLDAWSPRSAACGAVAAGLLAVVVLSNLRPPAVGQQTASPSASFEASVSAEPSARPASTADAFASQADRRSGSGADRSQSRSARPLLPIEDQQPKLRVGDRTAATSELEHRPGHGTPSTPPCRRTATGSPSRSMGEGTRAWSTPIAYRHRRRRRSSRWPARRWTHPSRASAGRPMASCWPTRHWRPDYARRPMSGSSTPIGEPTQLASPRRARPSRQLLLAVAMTPGCGSARPKTDAADVRAAASPSRCRADRILRTCR